MEFEALFNSLADKVLELLPLSPFQEFISELGTLPYLGYLNWFFPVKGCLVVLSAWLGAVGLFYLYSIVMRWLKMIGD